VTAKKVTIDSSWRKLLLTKETKSGTALRPITANASTILTYDPPWQGVIAYDEFAESIVTRSAPPWRPHDAETGAIPGDWTDEDTIRVQSWMAEKYGIDLGLEAILSAVKVVSRRSKFHPVRDWLSSLTWDAKRRLPTWLSDVMGCEDNEYTRAVGQSWAISAVARAFRPGCKVDTVLVLEGKPGTFKSSVIRALVGDAWFLEMSVTDIANKDAMQVLKRKWIGEFPEVDGYSKAEQSHLKSYLSRQVDTYRASYGKGSRDYPRQTVFAASTNKSEYLADETGGTGRRMWPVKCVAGNVSMAAAIRDQFWAEARTRFECGEEWHIRDPEIVALERQEQDARFRSHPWEESIATWLARPADLGSRAERGITTAEVMAGPLGIDVGKRTQADAATVGGILRRLGWVPGHPETRDGARVRAYRPAPGAGTNGHTLMPLNGAAPHELTFEPEEATEDSFPPVQLAD
jgi:putative DNA primase/helicase